MKTLTILASIVAIAGSTAAIAPACAQDGKGGPPAKPVGGAPAPAAAQPPAAKPRPLSPEEEKRRKQREAEEQAAAKAEAERKEAEAKAAEEKQRLIDLAAAEEERVKLEEQKAARAEAAKKKAEERRQKQAAWEARCVIKPAMSDEEIATCREVRSKPAP
jgi:hypothetical protein